MNCPKCNKEMTEEHIGVNDYYLCYQCMCGTVAIDDMSDEGIVQAKKELQNFINRHLKDVPQRMAWVDEYAEVDKTTFDKLKPIQWKCGDKWIDDFVYHLELMEN